MEKNGGFATLGFLYSEVLKIKECVWNTKTPFASIRRIVQDERYFFKIRPGLWALKSHKDLVSKTLLIPSVSDKDESNIFNHTYYQGLIVEIGNLKGFRTYIPNQDKNRQFINKRLCETVNLQEIYQFCYEDVIRKARTIDVIWFNERKMPRVVFEVEHSTNIINSLTKFVELQDFYVDFSIVADKVLYRLFLEKIGLSSFSTIKNRTKFVSYEDVSNWHSKAFEYFAISNTIGF